jgi:hypothetical protein
VPGRRTHVLPLSTPLTQRSCQMAWPRTCVASAEKMRHFIVASLGVIELWVAFVLIERQVELHIDA